MADQLTKQLREAYDRKVEERDRQALAPWKIEERQSFLSLLRKHDKPVLLAANKAESKASEIGVNEAFGLGLGEPVAISAEHGLGLSELERDALAAAVALPGYRTSRRSSRAP